MTTLSNTTYVKGFKKVEYRNPAGFFQSKESFDVIKCTDFCL